ncbi:hypothetical protein HDU76_008344, partial [Blyttiomyces sp. JEL0837]
MHSEASQVELRTYMFLCFITGSEVSIFTYNVNRNTVERIFGGTLKSLSRNIMRSQFLKQHSRSTPHSAVSADLSPTRAYSESGLSTYGGIADSIDFAQSGVIGEPELLQTHAVNVLHEYMRHLQPGFGFIKPTSLSTPSLGVGTVASSEQNPLLATARKQVISASTLGSPIRTGEIPLLPANAFNLYAVDGLSDQNRNLYANEAAKIICGMRALFSKHPWFFCPLLGSDLPGGEIDESGSYALPLDIDTCSPEFRKMIEYWYSELVSRFYGDYISYLQKLGLEFLDSDLPDQVKPSSMLSGLGISTTDVPDDGELSSQGPSSSSPKLKIFDNLEIVVKPVYLRKYLDGGHVIVQVGLEGCLIWVTMFVLRNSIQKPVFVDGGAGMRYGVESDTDTAFRKDIGQLKLMLHPTSFSYDFHLRAFLRILETEPDGNEFFDMLSALKSFAKFYRAYKVHSRSRILHGQLTTEGAGADLSLSLFRYIMANPTRYGFRPLCLDRVPVACFVTSDYPDFAPNGGSTRFTKGDFTYTTVIYIDKDSSDGGREGTSYNSVHVPGDETVCLRYFVIVLDKAEGFAPQSSASKSPSFLDPAYVDDLKEYLTSGCYLSDIIKFADAKILHLVEQALKFYDRDSLWSQMLNSPASDYISLSNCDWIKMFLEKIDTNSRSVLAIDPSLSDLLCNPDIPWPEVLIFLRDQSPNFTREFFDHESRTSHMIMFNQRNPDYLLHFMYRGSLWGSSSRAVTPMGRGVTMDRAAKRYSWRSGWNPPEIDENAAGSELFVYA